MQIGLLPGLPVLVLVVDVDVDVDVEVEVDVEVDVEVEVEAASEMIGSRISCSPTMVRKQIEEAPTESRENNFIYFKFPLCVARWLL